eukprot:m.111741 g.111741  ORF g.111741 m.111741 type:complete len:702 (-) comp13458_c0_seq3:1001-3106(-)
MTTTMGDVSSPEQTSLDTATTVPTSTVPLQAQSPRQSPTPPTLADIASTEEDKQQTDVSASTAAEEADAVTGKNAPSASATGSTVDTRDGEDTATVVELVKGPKGFGFSICGGQPFGALGMLPIVISNIKPDSPAASSALEIGHMIVSINGHSVEKEHQKIALHLIKGNNPLVLKLRKQVTHWIRQSAEDIKGGYAPQRNASTAPMMLPKAYEMVRINYAFRPSKPDELDLRPGDFVNVLGRGADGWCHGVCQRTKKRGYFPGNFAEKVRIRPTPQPTRQEEMYDDIDSVMAKPPQDQRPSPTATSSATPTTPFSRPQPLYSSIDGVMNEVEKAKATTVPKPELVELGTSPARLQPVYSTVGLYDESRSDSRRPGSEEIGSPLNIATSDSLGETFSTLPPPEETYEALHTQGVRTEQGIELPNGDIYATVVKPVRRQQSANGGETASVQEARASTGYSLGEALYEDIDQVVAKSAAEASSEVAAPEQERKTKGPPPPIPARTYSVDLLNLPALNGGLSSDDEYAEADELSVSYQSVSDMGLVEKVYEKLPAFFQVGGSPTLGPRKTFQSTLHELSEDKEEPVGSTAAGSSVSSATVTGSTTDTAADGTAISASSASGVAASTLAGASSATAGPVTDTSSLSPKEQKKQQELAEKEQRKREKEAKKRLKDEEKLKKKQEKEEEKRKRKQEKEAKKQQKAKKN